MPMKLYVGDIVQTRKNHPVVAISGRLCAWGWIFVSAVPIAGIKCGFPV